MRASSLEIPNLRDYTMGANCEYTHTLRCVMQLDQADSPFGCAVDPIRNQVHQSARSVGQAEIFRYWRKLLVGVAVIAVVVILMRGLVREILDDATGNTPYAQSQK
jgi:hypothetical protein